MKEMGLSYTCSVLCYNMFHLTSEGIAVKGKVFKCKYQWSEKKVFDTRAVNGSIVYTEQYNVAQRINNTSNSHSYFVVYCNLKCRMLEMHTFDNYLYYTPQVLSIMYEIAVYASSVRLHGGLSVRMSTYRYFTFPVFSATMNIRKILTSIFPWRNMREVLAGCSGGCSEYRPVVYFKTDIS